MRRNEQNTILEWHSVLRKKIDIDFYLDASGRVVDQDLIVSFG